MDSSLVSSFEMQIYSHSLLINQLIEAGLSYTEAKEMELEEINLFLGTYYAITEKRLQNNG